MESYVYVVCWQHIVAFTSGAEDMHMIAALYPGYVPTDFRHILQAFIAATVVMR